MNDAEPISPLPPEHVVELLSAELDGAFDAAARDLGYTPEDARARLASAPRAAEQRDALARARADLAVTTLDDDVRSRLVAHALGAAPSDRLAARRLRLTPRVIGSVAAAALVVVGIAAALSIDRSGDDDASLTTEAAQDSAGASTDEMGEAGDGRAATGSIQPLAAVPYFGDVSDPEDLRRRLAAEQSTGALSGAVADETTPEYEGGEGDTQQSAPAPAALVDDACVAARADAFGGGAPVLRGLGTYNSERIEVLVFATRDSIEALVVGVDCTVRERVSLPPQP